MVGYFGRLDGFERFGDHRFDAANKKEWERDCGYRGYAALVISSVHGSINLHFKADPIIPAETG